MSEPELYFLGLSAVAFVIVGLGIFAGYRPPVESRAMDLCVGLAILLAVPAGWLSAKFTGLLGAPTFMGILIFVNLVLFTVAVIVASVIWRLVQDWRSGRRGRFL